MIFSAKLRINQRFPNLKFSGQPLKRQRISNNGQIIEYEVVHRPKVTRCIHLELAEHGTLQVVAPRRLSRRVIQATMQEWADYVARFLAEAKAQQQDIPVFAYVSGEQHLFMGQSYPLDILESNGKPASVELADGCIQIISPGGEVEDIRACLTGWYRKEAGRYFSERLAAFSQAASWTGGKSPVMRLRLMKRTWGTCSAKGVITLNPHLVKAPPECIDYVVAHELCHLREHNHSRAFYSLQEHLYPGWRMAKARLQNQAHIYLHG
jgi:predicted metal-dependent hydrolase